MTYAIFTRRDRNGLRKMHSVPVGTTITVCGLPTGTGTGLVRDGDYRDNVPCGECWPKA